MEVEKKKIKVSKNKKKSWRKHVDVTDVEEHLEEKRRDERTGGPTKQKTSESLFFVDKSKSKLEKVQKSSRKKNTKDDQDTDDDEESYVPKKQQEAKKLEKQHAQEGKRMKESRNKKIVDIWGQDVIAVVENDFLEPTVKRAKVKPVTFGKGKLNIDAVTVPDAGASYNPHYDAHQELLAKAHNTELKKLKRHRKISKKVKMVSVDELKKQSAMWLKEMTEGLPGFHENTQDDDSEQSDDDGCIYQSSTRPKTSQQKRKAKLAKLVERERLDMKLAKRRLSDIYRLKKMKKEIKQAELEHEQLIKERREMSKLRDETRVKRLSKIRFQEDNVSVQLSEDLSGSLRELKPEGNLLKDRFKSLQRRNIIEIRRPVVPHRKYKLKVYTKRSYNTPTIGEFNTSIRKKTKK